MKFAEFLDILQDEKQAGKYYLTTQYEQDAGDDVEDDEWPALDPTLPSPTHKLQSDMPLHPRILGHLALQQCNFWVGSTQSPTSSGLHHDFHDNLYILLGGHKRFVLFPPTAYPYLHLRGHVQKVHKNGLLVYEPGERIRADGLDELEAAHWRVATRAHQGRSAKVRRGAQQDVHGSYAAAKQALDDLRAQYADDEEHDEEEEDVQQLQALEDEEDTEDEDAEQAETNVFRNDEEEGEEEEEDFDNDDDFEANEGDEHLLDMLNAEDSEPQSFSRIPTSTLHKHFEIKPAIASSAATNSLTPEPGCPQPLVVDLEPGQMLYLPASWFHEVTSTGAKDAPHMALNYWMHPPDGRTFDEPYTDTEIWTSIKQRIHSSNEN